MKKIELLFFILTLSIIGITSCRKPEKVYHYLNQTIKDYTVFPVNSYWVYIDSITGIKDSTYVVSAEQSFYQRREDNNCYEHIISNCFSTRLNKLFDRESYFSELSLDCIYIDNDTCKFASDIQLGDTNHFVIYKDFYDSIIIRSNVYKNIMVFYCSDFDNSYYYFAKNVGLIKQKSDSSVVELDHYHINN